MTTTNHFDGLPDHRNSSRVLRPPGGGNSDPLGVKSGPAAPPTMRHNPRNVSSITEGTNSQPVVASPVKPSKHEPPQAQPEEAPKQRQRVPPGGFSSGLW